MHINALSINVARTFAMLFSNRRLCDPDDLLLPDGKGVQFEQSGKFQGIVIDNQLNFKKTYILYTICNKISKLLLYSEN